MNIITNAHCIGLLGVLLSWIILSLQSQTVPIIGDLIPSVKLNNQHQYTHLSTWHSLLCKNEVWFEGNDIAALLLDVVLLQFQQPSKVSLLADLDVRLQRRPSCDYHVTIMWLPQEFYATITWPSCDYHRNITRLSHDHYVSTTGTLYDYHMTIMWLAYDHHMI